MLEPIFLNDTHGEPTHVVLTLNHWERICDLLEDRLDEDAARHADQVKRDVAEGRDEMVPLEMAQRIFDGEHPVRVWREHRDLTQVQLAEAAGVSQSAIAHIERGASSPSLETLRRIAKALRVDLDDLEPANQDDGTVRETV